MNYFRKMLSPKTGVSSKRFIGVSSVIIIYLIALVNLFTGKTVTDYVFEGLIWLAIGGIFGISSEQFADAIKAKSGSTTTDITGTQPIDDPDK